jgi:hypothetical protein
MSYAEIRDVLGAVRAVCQTQAVTVDTHDRGAGYCGTIRFFFVRQYDRQLSASIRL